MVTHDYKCGCGDGGEYSHGMDEDDADIVCRGCGEAGGLVRQVCAPNISAFGKSCGHDDSQYINTGVAMDASGNIIPIGTTKEITFDDGRFVADCVNLNTGKKTSRLSGTIDPTTGFVLGDSF